MSIKSVDLCSYFLQANPLSPHVVPNFTLYHNYTTFKLIAELTLEFPSSYSTWSQSNFQWHSSSFLLLPPSHLLSLYLLVNSRPASQLFFFFENMFNESIIFDLSITQDRILRVPHLPMDRHPASMGECQFYMSICSMSYLSIYNIAFFEFRTSWTHIRRAWVSVSFI